MLFSLYQSFILSKPKTVLLVLLAILLGLAVAIPRTAFDASSDSLVLEGDKDLEYARGVSKRYSSSDFLVVAYTPKEALFTPAGIAKLTEIHDRLAQLPNIQSVLSVLDVPLLYSPKVGLNDLSNGFKTLRAGNVDLHMAQAEFTTSAVYKSLLTNTEATTTAIQINIKPDEKYRRLQVARDDLRAKLRAEGLSDAERQQLAAVSLEFKTYKLEASVQQEALVAEARAILASFAGYGELFLGGVPMIAVDMVSFIKGDLATLGIGGIIVIIALMIFFFRSIRWVAIPLLTVGFTLVMMLGFLATIDWRMTVISSNFVAILLVVNLSILIHLVVRYREIATEHPNLSTYNVVSQTTAFMAKPCIYTTLTTLVAFASLVISGIRPVIDFGWMMTIGVSLALINSFLVMPALLLILPRETVLHKESDQPLTLRFAGIVEKRGSLLLAAVLVIAVLAGYGVSKLQVENRFIDYFHEDTEIYQGMTLIDAELGGTIPFDIIIDADDEVVTEVALSSETLSDEDPFEDDFFDDEFGGGDVFASDHDTAAATSVWFTRSGMERVKSVHDYLEANPELGKVLSLATLYDVFGELAGKDIDDIQLALVKQNLPDLVNDVMVTPYFNEGSNQARISIRAKETSHTLNRNDLLNQIRSDLVNELGFDADKVHVSGVLVMYNNMLQSLYTSQILTLGAVFIAIMLMFFVLFRSLKLAFIAIFPNMLAAMIVLGGMGIAGIPLDLMTITIAAICIGIGVDDTVHYIYRFKEEFAIEANYHSAMYKSHASIGKAMYYTSVIIVVGFGVLALSNFTPTIYFGLLTGAGMVAALVGALLILPRLILLFKPFGPERA
mgnify:CR=1 FL=1